ncbi:MAG: hypothetical protein ACIALR_04150 [Blastopirellula sp. JB062]
MPIDFTCQVCKQQIRVADGNEGKRTKCPHCSAIQPIPGGAAPEERPFADSEQFGEDRPAPNPFAEQPPRQEAGESNPYASPYSAAAGSAPMAFEEAKSKLSVPVIVCMVSAVLSVMLLGVSLLGTVVNLVNGVQQPEEAAIGMMTCSFYFVANAVCLFTLYSTLNLRSKAQAWIGFILALTPCTNCCFLIGLPFAIWGMVVLSDAEVQRQFKN